MHRIFLTVAFILAIGFSESAFSGSVYTWTDADGTRRFSNVPPSDGTQNFETMDELQTDPEEIRQAQEERDRMMWQISQEAEQRDREQAEKKEKEAEARKNQQMAEQAARVFTERQRLEKEMEAISKRGLGSNFGPGQKAALMGEIQKKMDQLESDPDAYFKK